MPADNIKRTAPSQDVTAQAFAMEAGQLINLLVVDPDSVLSQTQVSSRIEKYGLNELEKTQTRSAWPILIEQLRGIVIYILIAAACVSFLFGEKKDGIAISLVIVINTWGNGVPMLLRRRRRSFYLMMNLALSPLQ